MLFKPDPEPQLATWGDVHPSWIVDLSNSTRFGLGSCGVDDVDEVGAPLPFSLLSTLLNDENEPKNDKKWAFFGGIFEFLQWIVPLALAHEWKCVHVC